MAYCSRPPWSRRVRRRFRCTLGRRRRRWFMKSRGLLPVQGWCGLKAIGNRWVTATDGCGGIGSVHHLKVHTGRIRTMTTTAKAGCCMKDIGTAKTTTTITGEIMIADGGMGITMMIMGMSIMIRNACSDRCEPTGVNQDRKTWSIQAKEPDRCRRRWDEPRIRMQGSGKSVI